MPKQTKVIRDFSGGLNTFGNQRDIQDNELVLLDNFAVRSQGSLTTAGIAVQSTSDELTPYPTALAANQRPGHNLFAFSTDRHYNGRQLDGTFIEGEEWVANSDSQSSNHVNIFGRYNGGFNEIDGAVTAAADGVINTDADHNLTTSDYVRFTGISGTIGTLLNNTIHKVKAITDADTFTIEESTSGKSGSGGLAKGGYAGWIHSDDEPIPASADPAMIDFAFVDGALRTSSSNFADSAGSNKWWGYIDRDLFVDTSYADSVAAEWYPEEAAIEPPTIATFKDGEAIGATPANTHTYDPGIILAAAGTDTDFTTESDMDGDLGDVPHITIIEVTIEVLDELGASGAYADVTLKIGKSADSGGSYSGTDHHTFYMSGRGSATLTKTWTGDWDIDTNGLTRGILSTLVVPASGVSSRLSFEVTEIKLMTAGGASWADHLLTGNEVHVGVIDASLTGATGWNTDWEIGVSLLYDKINKQESIIRLCTNETVGGDGEVTFASGNAPEIAVFINYDNDLADFTDATCDYNDDPAIEHDDDDGAIKRGMFVSGTGIPDGAYVASIESDTEFELSEATTDGSVTNGTLTFTATNLNWRKRVTGCKVYMREIKAPASSDRSEWYPQCTCDFLRGEITAYESGHTETAFYDTSGKQHIFYLSKAYLIRPHKRSTYEIESGVPDDEEVTMMRYKTSVIANRRLYVGNIYVTYADNTSVRMGDTMIKSVVNKFDIIPLSSKIDVVIRDGDDIVRLEEYADRILQFKKKTLYIINIAQDVEYLEGTYRGKGVPTKSAVTKTDYGIAWVNRHGCYLYNGRTIIDLLMSKRGDRLIGPEEWRGFVNEALDTPVSIGYSQSGKILVVDGNADENTYENAYVYDFKTGSWRFQSGGVPDQGNHGRSNMVQRWDGELMYGSYGTFFTFKDEGTRQSNGHIITKEFQLAPPNKKVKLYNVYITYKTTDEISSAATRVRYATDGNKQFSLFNTVYKGGSTVTVLASTFKYLKNIGTVVETNEVFTDNSCDGNNDPTITHNDDDGDIGIGMFVSGTGIPAGAYVASVTSDLEFELSASTTGGSFTNRTLTFSGIAALATTDNITLDNTYELNVGDYITIESVSEIMKVLEIKSSTEIKVQRGAFDTTIEGGNDNKDISRLCSDQARFEITTPVKCSSVQLDILPAVTTYMEIEEIIFEYRPLFKEST